MFVATLSPMARVWCCMSADSKYTAAVDALDVDMFILKPVAPRQLSALVSRLTGVA